ncbi:MAG: DNA polymerase III subunit gamma/tau [Clostridiales bacterium]|nr:DNA polymerase III subunit gamma/tau [Clostridiales bacterium]
MAYSALYRRLRPRSFADVVGQGHIVRTLKNQITTGRISHAYLFCGTRGTGKTTTALIFAKAVNCLSPKDGDPCGECAACHAVERGGGFNVIEIDAASNNGVENIRDIREEVKYPPAEGKTKTYIIDEVHMLSASAFNALLKTLEEPPPGVIFILATTDPQKIPGTVHSRCQRFDFKRVSVADMTEAVARYLTSEGIDFEMDAVRHAARIADGSMRDVLSILDQCASFYMGERITLDKVMDITGSVDAAVLSRLALALSKGAAAEYLLIIEDILQGGRDAHQVVSELIAHLRNLLIISTAGGSAGKLLDASDEGLAELRKTASELTPSLLTRYITVLSELTAKMRYAGNPRILLEAACIGLAEPVILATKDTKDTKKTIKPENISDKAAEEPVDKIINGWGAFLSSFGAVERNMLAEAKPERGPSGILRIVCGNAAIYDFLKRKREEISAKLAERFGEPVRVEIVPASGD